jgi:hypothetical protein
MTDKTEKSTAKKRGKQRSGEPWRQIVSCPAELAPALREMVRVYRATKAAAAKLKQEPSP